MIIQTRTDIPDARRECWSDEERETYRRTGVRPENSIKPSIMQQIDRAAVKFEHRFMRLVAFFGLLMLGTVLGVVWRVLANVP